MMGLWLDDWMIGWLCSFLLYEMATILIDGDRLPFYLWFGEGVDGNCMPARRCEGSSNGDTSSPNHGLHRRDRMAAGLLTA